MQARDEEKNLRALLPADRDRIQSREAFGDRDLEREKKLIEREVARLSRQFFGAFSLSSVSV